VTRTRPMAHAREDPYRVLRKWSSAAEGQGRKDLGPNRIRELRYPAADQPASGGSERGETAALSGRSGKARRRRRATQRRRTERLRGLAAGEEEGFAAVGGSGKPPGRGHVEVTAHGRSFSDACGVSCRVRAGNRPAIVPFSGRLASPQGRRETTTFLGPPLLPSGFLRRNPGTGQDSAVSARRTPWWEVRTNIRQF
jgi:hypothetical protein